MPEDAARGMLKTSSRLAFLVKLPMVNFRSDDAQYSTQSTVPAISSRPVHHFGKCEHNIRPPLLTAIPSTFVMRLV